MLMAKSGGSSSKLYPEDVFSTYLYTGNGSTQTITNGIDLAGEGGLVWIKGRSGATSHMVADTARGVGYNLITDTTGSQGYSPATFVTAFNSNGFGIGSVSTLNTNAATYASWTFRKAPKFFDVQTKSHTVGTATTIDLSVLGTVGMVTVKATSTTSNWYTWHRGLTSGNNLTLNLTDAQSTTNAYLSVSGTTLTIASTTPTASYVVYAWAHDDSADGMIQCGSYTGTSADQLINLGFEAQFVMVKSINNTGSWLMADSMRGMPVSGAFQDLEAQSSAAEAAYSPAIIPNASGFSVASASTSVNASASTYIYLAIRRPNKPPTSGTEVYNAIINSGTLSTNSIISGFPTDLMITKPQNLYAGYAKPYFYDRLRGGKGLISSSTDWEILISNPSIVIFHNTGLTVGAHDGVTTAAPYGAPYITQHFRRASGFFDIVCYTGTGVARTVNHNLGVVPELIIVKSRSVTGYWATYHAATGNNAFTVINGTNALLTPEPTAWNSTTPTATQFTVGTYTSVNTSAATYVAYLFATSAGISKVGSYTGNGSSQTINCGFSAGSRFILIKRTDSAGDWYVWDSVRGIVAANDPHLSLNTAVAEVTTDDSIDPDNSGFIVNQVSATNINVNGASYIFLSIS